MGKWNHKNHKTQQKSIGESESEITKQSQVKQVFYVFYREGKWKWEWNHKSILTIESEHTKKVTHKIYIIERKSENKTQKRNRCLRDALRPYIIEKKSKIVKHKINILNIWSEWDTEAS